ncbi:hypothetical protein BH11VER1_BH11VER1_39750 [soil metagenome]
MPVLPSRLLRALLLTAAALLIASPLRAQVVVYRLSFEQTGDSINYRPYQNGYYIAPLEGGTGSLILTLVTGAQRQYFTYASFGDLFVALKGENKKMVLSAAATNEVSTTTFYAIGTADKEIEVESRNATSQVKVAGKMVGYSVSADSEKDLPFAGSGTSVGVAGVSVLTAKFDEQATNEAIKNSLDVAGQVTAITTLLEGAGYVNGKPATNNGGQTTNPATPTGN